MTKLKKAIKSCPALMVVIGVILLVVSVVLKKTLTAPSAYTFEEGKIVVHSLKDGYGTFLLVLFFIMTVQTAVAVVLALKKREKTGEKVLSMILGYILFSLMSAFCYLSVVWSWDYSPCCYEFTEGKHTIVIEEISFLLYGGANVYQIKDGHAATLIGHFGTDDGGRNKGNYDLTWHDDSVEITYDDQNGSHNMITVTVPLSG